MSAEWKPHVKGDPLIGGWWEISVIRKDFQHGFESFGWFSEDKKILIANSSQVYTAWTATARVYDLLLLDAKDKAEQLSSKSE